MPSSSRQIQRRTFLGILCSATLRPILAHAQSSMPVIGFLGSESPRRSAGHLRGFHQGLSEASFVEGQNVSVEYRWAEGRNDRLPALLADLVARHVNVIAAPGTTPGALAAKAATTTIPVVFFTAGDPVALKLVASLNRPGGNLTGATSLGAELAPKRLELLHQLVPRATGMGVLVNPSNPALAEAAVRELQEPARKLGLRLHVVQASREDELESAFLALTTRLRAEALVITVDSFFTGRAEQLGQLAVRHRIPAIYQRREFVAAGGLISYGGSLTEGYRVVGVYAGRILRGEKPADLPVQQVTRVELIVNMKTAKELGRTIPPTLLAVANEVIE